MSLHISNIIQLFEEWAPLWAAWEKDNVGLQVGNKLNRVTNVLVTLDVTERIIDEAIEKKVNLIVSHHPLLFRPPSAIIASDPIGAMVLRLARHSISLFSAHTNLDHAPGGVNFVLAERIGLNDLRFLAPVKNSLAKIVVFAPHEHVERLVRAMTQAGAGVIGHYSSCSFRTKGTGSFYGSQDSTPFLGKKKTLVSVEETRLEMVAPRALVRNVVAALKAVHPYEEPAYDIHFIENTNPNFGLGVHGKLKNPQSLGSFLKSLKRIFDIRMIRHTGNLARTIEHIAVCGGAGGDLLPEALSANVDAFITSDIRYHTFQKAGDTLALIDAGHWETEQLILKPIAERLKSAARAAHEPLTVMITKHKTNPIKIF